MMMTSIRNASANWLGKAVLTVIMGFLILSFAVWGIGDMLRINPTQSAMKIGTTEISAETLRRNFTDEIQRLSQRLRRPITQDMAKAMGLDKQVLNRVITETTLDEEAKKLGLALPEAEVVKSIVNEAGFKNAAGQFDRNQFNQVLRDNGLTEAGFVVEQRRSLLRRQIAMSLSADLPVPNAFLEAAHRYRAETRDVEYITIAPEAADKIAAGPEADVKAFYDLRKAEFQHPEYRKINLLSVNAKQLAGDVKLDEKDLRAAYEEGVKSGKYGTPEKRRLDQVSFETEADAQAFAKKLGAGETFEQLASARKLKAEDMDLGIKTKGEFLDDAAGNAAFMLQKAGAISAPIKTAFGFQILRLVAIEAGNVKAFESVKATLNEEALALKYAKDPDIQRKLEEITRKVEDGRIAGKPLSELAAITGQKIQTIEAITASGLDKSGKTVTLTDAKETLKAVFASDIGLDNEMLNLNDGSHLWFEIAGIEAAREKTFDEVKAEVNQRWKQEEATKRLAEKARGIVEKINTGATLASIASENGVKIEASKTLTRIGQTELGQGAQLLAFNTPVGKALSALSVDSKGRVIAKVLNSTTPPYTAADPQNAALTKQFNESFSEDIVNLSVKAFQKDLGFTQNERSMAMMLNGAN